MKIFISYSSRDRVEALALKQMVEALGHDAWMDLFDIQPAAKLTQALQGGVHEADALFLLLSPSAVASKWVLDEIGYALQAKALGLELVPIILRPAPIPDDLADIVAIDATAGIESEVVSHRIRQFLQGDLSEGVRLDAVERAELGDRAARDEAEQAFPAIGKFVERVLDQPLRELSLEIDHDTWPHESAGVLELVLILDHEIGSAHFLVAPYHEGHTWDPESGIAERPPEDFFASDKPRIDARFSWADEEEHLHAAHDATDLGELPVRLGLTLDGRPYQKRGVTLALIDKVELPPLRRLFNAHSRFRFWDHGGAEPVELDSTDIDARLLANVIDDERKHQVCLWRSRHDRDERVLLESSTLKGLATQIEKEIFLAEYRGKGLRSKAHASERRAAIVEAVDRGSAIPAQDTWAAFHLLVGRARLAAFRGRRESAAEQFNRAIGLVIENFDEDTASYCDHFRIWKAAMSLLQLLKEKGAPEAVQHYGDLVVDLPRAMLARHPDEPDYARALSRALMARAEMLAPDERDVGDLDEAMALIDELAHRRPDLPWRIEEARSTRARANELRPATAPAPEPRPLPVYAKWLDAGARAAGIPTLLISRLPAWSAFLPEGLSLGDRHLHLVEDQLVCFHRGRSALEWFSVGCRETRDRIAWTEQAILARPPFTLASDEPFDILEWAPAETGDLADRLEADQLDAVRIEIGQQGRHGWAYLLHALVFDLSWTVGLCIPGEQVASVVEADGMAAVTFARARLPFEPK